MTEYQNPTIEKAHNAINSVFREILPKYGRAVREGQIDLCHHIFDSLYSRSICLGNAAVGVGKTDAYLIAAVILNEYRLMESEDGSRTPFVIATSSIQLQKAILKEYIPFLSAALHEAGVISSPFTGILRKGKGNYACPLRVQQRIGNLNMAFKNYEKSQSLLRLLQEPDMDTVGKLSGFDRAHVCVPDACPGRCPRVDACRYMDLYREKQKSSALFHVCNHNYYMADALNRHRGYAPMLPDYRAVIIDEAHKFEETAREMCGYQFGKEDVEELMRLLQIRLGVSPKERKTFQELFSMFTGEPETEAACEPDAEQKKVLQACLEALQKAQDYMDQHNDFSMRYLVHKIGTTLKPFHDGNGNYLCSLRFGKDGAPSFSAIPLGIQPQMRALFWEQPEFGVIMTSGTLAVRDSFAYVKHQLGLKRIAKPLDEVIIPSPYDYGRNCLLYFPRQMPSCRDDEGYRNAAIQEIKELIKVTHGHTLILFTAYSDMQRAYGLLKEADLGYPLFALNKRNDSILQAFRDSSNGVLLATNAWEGMDFPGDIVSSLIIYKLPFPMRTPFSDAQRGRYMSQKEYIAAVCLPQMLIKLLQGFGRGIRREDDTCVISILDGRAGIGRGYHRAVREALPDMPATNNIEVVSSFLKDRKDDNYYHSEGEE